MFRSAAPEHLIELRTLAERLPQNHAGLRLHGIEDLGCYLSAQGPIGQVATAIIGPDATAVRAILFDKTDRTNWSLAWHQDRTICVKRKVKTEGFGPWTIKQGILHVAPPFEVLAHMVTLRVHLDDVPATNAPLLIAPGSHKRGRITVHEIDEIVRNCGMQACLAEAGDVWSYATPILHASSAAIIPTRRRVLQVDYNAKQLPGELEWLGV
ncbi:MAG: phytanoyl-CoA dioxygenase [Sphingomonadales bacterium]|nr:MAG: phytanoyl-CoA dioxygenase [Sphingomonadales bacterium]TNF04315.1 MAG: phytanoyl-CoA dioxygenase [Sphingomonadales bacterium]